MAIDASVAKKCDALVASKFPPFVVGNPAAGSKGTAKDRRDFFAKCVNQNGKMDDSDPKDTK